MNPPSINLEQALEGFISRLLGKNRSAATIAAYRTDVSSFIEWLHQNNDVVSSPSEVERADVGEYLSELARRGLTGVSRARKLAALREYFRYLEAEGRIVKLPATGIETPKKEKPGAVYLRLEEYSRMLALAGSNPRDYAILQVFLQTGIRVSELCQLEVDDIDLEGRALRVASGKGMAAREIELEKKAITAIRNYLAIRPEVPHARLFLNRFGDPIGERGVRRLVVCYRQRAGITKKASCHSLRHTFATFKAERGVSPFQLRDWLGHASIATTQIYVHMARRNARKVMEATSL